MSFYTVYYYNNGNVLAADGSSYPTAQESIQWANELNARRAKPKKAYRYTGESIFNLKELAPVPNGYWVPKYSGPYNPYEPDPSYHHPAMDQV